MRFVSGTQKSLEKCQRLAPFKVVAVQFKEAYNSSRENIGSAEGSKRPMEVAGRESRGVQIWLNLCNHLRFTWMIGEKRRRKQEQQEQQLKR